MKFSLSLFACFACSVVHAAPISLSWDSSLTTNCNYILHWGTNRGSWFWHTNVGTALTATVDVAEGRTWYFTVSAVNTNGLESDPSNEVWKTLGTNQVAAPGLKGVTTTSQLEAAPNVDGPWLPLLDLQTVTLPRTHEQRFVRARMTEEAARSATYRPTTTVIRFHLTAIWSTAISMASG